MHCSFQLFAGSVASVCVPPENVPLGNWNTESLFPDMIQLIWLKGTELLPLVRLEGLLTVRVATPLPEPGLDHAPI